MLPSSLVLAELKGPILRTPNYLITKCAILFPLQAHATVPYCTLLCSPVHNTALCSTLFYMHSIAYSCQSVLCCNVLPIMYRIVPHLVALHCAVVCCCISAESAAQGRVLVLSPTGSLLSTILTPGAEISGLAIKDNMLYITEKSSGSILRVEL